MRGFLSPEEGAALIQEGGIVAYPTETFYGLAADPKNPKALACLFQLKGRDAGKPIALILSHPDQLDSWVETPGPLAQKLMEIFWPGPLTLVFQAKPWVLGELTAHTHKIGVRISPDGVASRLAHLAGGAITATSANLSGEPALKSGASVSKKLGASLSGIVDGSPRTKRLGSTFVDMTTATPHLLRAGALPWRQIEKVILKNPKV